MSSVKRRNILFLGFAIPDEEMEKMFKIDALPQVQTHKFNWNFIKGLEIFDEFDFTYISTRPITDYPICSQMYQKKNKWIEHIDFKEIEINEIPFINIGILKMFSRLFSALYYSVREFHKKSNKAGVIVYSVHIPYMIVGFIVSKVYGVDYIAIWTDPPAVISNRDSFLKTKLRNLEFMLSKYFMKRVSKVVALTKYLAEDFAPGKPYVIIEGIINVKDANQLHKKNEKSSNSPKIFVYTGSLEKKYGIENIVNGFLALKYNNAILEIYGRGDFEKELIEIVKSNNKIVYRGFVSNSEILKIQRNADFLINARSDKEEFTKYSFPSKTIEYMLSGTPLITTILPGMPEEYKDYVIILENNSPDTIKATIENTLNMDQYEIYNIGEKARKFALSKNYQNQGKKIIDFINH